MEENQGKIQRSSYSSLLSNLFKVFPPVELGQGCGELSSGDSQFADKETQDREKKWLARVRRAE